MSEYLYTEDHQWIRDEGDNHATIGITEYAQEQLGDVVYVEVPEIGAEISQHDEIGVVESVKTTADLQTPASGSVIRINERIAEEPELLNSDPLGDGWLIRIEMSDATELEDLLNEEEYQNLVATQS